MIRDPHLVFDEAPCVKETKVRIKAQTIRQERIIMDFPSIERINEILDELAEELPPIFFEKLNLGIVLLDEMKRHPASQGDDLWILGEYTRGPIGNGIRLYYLSLKTVFNRLDEQSLVEKLRGVLRHEFRHHLEFLSGERGLEIEDEAFLKAYQNRKRPK